MKKKLFVPVASLAVLLAVLLTGCGSAASTNDAPALGQKGYLTLRVNPEIRIEYNAEGLVTALEGRNDDGKAIAASYTDYIGKECSTVLRELVTDIHEAGYFIEDAEGGKRQVVLQIEPGSALPDDDFLELLHRDVQAEISKLDLSAPVVNIDGKDYDDRYEKDGRPSPYITLDKAREIALAHAGVKAEDAVWDDREFDFENGQPIFELEFDAGGTEYEYDIDAASGEILLSKTSRSDDRPAASAAKPSGSTAKSSADSTPKPSASASSSYIGLEKAKSVALKKAGVSAADVRWEKAELDRDDGRAVYELEFDTDSAEYDVDVHAESGKILSYESDRHDDWDDRYDDWDDDDWDDDDWDDDDWDDDDWDDDDWDDDDWDDDDRDDD